MPVLVPEFISVTLGLVVYFIGAQLTRSSRFLRTFYIPEPVSGGLAVALATWAYFLITGREIVFDLAARDYFLVAFFTTVGLNARIADLFAGGNMLLRLLALTCGFIVLQNAVGVIGTQLFDLPMAVSVLIGSASLIGGHGTAIAWGPTIVERTGFAAAAEIGIAAATLGLIFAALIGGPIAKYLIDRNALTSDPGGAHLVGLQVDEDGGSDQSVTHVGLMRSMLAVHIAILFGFLLGEVIEGWGLQLPSFVPCLLVGIAMSNTLPYLFPKMIWPAGTRSMAVVADYSLSIFLAMSLMSMQLWGLADLGGPLLVVLLLQVVMTAVFVIFVVFAFMGRDYTAAVLSAGFAGFGLGATPTAVANMSSVTKNYGPAPLAFIILPLVSAFFVDLINAVVIQMFVSL